MSETRLLTQWFDDPSLHTIEGYEKHGGYEILKQTLGKQAPTSITQQVLLSGLRGRGGAGFLTGKKWGFLAQHPTRYLVCNCDESEPGAFKDRYLIERDPHQLIEGLILAAYALQVSLAFIYCRGEFYEGMDRLRQAIDQATTAGYIGKNILNSSYDLHIILHPGAGAYIAGEETAQLNSIEGYRATPRLKPPFPASQGLYGRPTIINNVETLCNITHIVKMGAEAYQKIGTPNNSGTKIFQVSGMVQRPGCYEYPLGVELRTVLEGAGGMLPGKRFKACYPGGSSCVLLTEQDLSIAMDFDTLSKRGSALGTASIIVLDDSVSMVTVARRLMQFYERESCGKCTPCREGTRWVSQILRRIETGRGTESDLDTVMRVCLSLEQLPFCPLAMGAAPPIQSAIRAFPKEFEEAIRKNPMCHSPPPFHIAYPYQEAP